MPHRRRKNPAILVSPARTAPRAAKRARPRRPLTTIQEEVILAAEAEKQLPPPEPIDMDSEDEFMDLGLENGLLPYPIPENLTPTLTSVPALTTAVQRPSPQKILERNSSQGLSSSIPAPTKDIANE